MPNKSSNGAQPASLRTWLVSAIVALQFGTVVYFLLPRWPHVVLYSTLFEALPFSKNFTRLAVAAVLALGGFTVLHASSEKRTIVFWLSSVGYLAIVFLFLFGFPVLRERVLGHTLKGGTLSVKISWISPMTGYPVEVFFDSDGTEAQGACERRLSGEELLFATRSSHLLRLPAQSEMIEALAHDWATATVIGTGGSRVVARGLRTGGLNSSEFERALQRFAELIGAENLEATRCQESSPMV